MNTSNRLLEKLNSGEFIYIAEYLPPAGTDCSSIAKYLVPFSGKLAAVNVADNHYGIAMSSFAASLAVKNIGFEPILQLATRDRNRFALQSDLLGAASLGINNVLCLTGIHPQTLGWNESSGIFELDSSRLIEVVKKMNNGTLLDGRQMDGNFSMLIGAVVNPYMMPQEFNLIRFSKKINAGADFVQTEAVFDVETFEQWLYAVGESGITGKVAILAGVLPLESLEQAVRLREKFSDVTIPDFVIERLSSAGGPEA